MIEILRNMARRKLRTGLTVMGIVIGIFALTVMGAMSEYFNTLLDNAVKQVGTNIIISPQTRDFESILTINDQRKVERVPGVRFVIPLISDTLQEFTGVSLGIPDVVVAAPPELVQYILPAASLNRGRWLQRGDTYQAVIGSKIASKYNLDVGGTIEYREHDFTVVGIMNETQTSPDSEVLVPIETARRLLKSPDLIIGIYVVPQDTNRADELAARIKEAVGDLNVQTPRQLVEQVQQGLAIFNVILLSGAVVAVIVGGLAVINTMLMSVNERVHEIGLKKAIGATDGEIVREYVIEAALLGLMGGLIGFGLGFGTAELLNAVASESLGGSEIFVVTTRLAGIVLAFAVMLGAGAGVFPAWSAARLDPVTALRTE